MAAEQKTARELEAYRKLAAKASVTDKLAQGHSLRRSDIVTSLAALHKGGGADGR